MEHYEKLVQKVVDLREDVEKAKKGNQTAAVRIRAAMQEVKSLAQDIRVAALGLKKG